MKGLLSHHCMCLYLFLASTTEITSRDYFLVFDANTCYFGLLLSQVSLGLQVVTMAACKMVITDPCLRVSTPCGIPFSLAWAELKNSLPMNRTGQISEVSALRLCYKEKKKKRPKNLWLSLGVSFLIFSGGEQLSQGSSLEGLRWQMPQVCNYHMSQF